MTRIIAVRYEDVDEEERLSRDLLAWAQCEQDRYAEAFALTFLGDCGIAAGVYGHASECLERAYEIIGPDEDTYPELATRMNTFLGICEEMLSNETGAVRHHLKAARLAHRIEDPGAECVALNNLAFVFQRHRSFEEALRYYNAAYALLVVNPNPVLQPLILSNLIDVNIKLGHLDEASERMEECEAISDCSDAAEAIVARNRCLYCAALGDADGALFHSGRVLALIEVLDEDPLCSFDNYEMLFTCMLDIGDGDHARRFLDLMAANVNGVADRSWKLEEMQMKYVLAFDPPERHADAYRIFFEKIQGHARRTDAAVAKTMRMQIDLVDTVRQKEHLEAEQESLEQEASIDELTQVPNRRSMNLLLSDKTTAFGDAPFGAIMVDIDFFKEYNDHYGHLGGDAVLREVGRVLVECADESIKPFRFGGDEFVCLCDGLDSHGIESYIRSVRKAVAMLGIPHEMSPFGKTVTLSIGYSYATQDQGISPYSIMQAADVALYETKQSGRDSFSGSRVG